MFEKFFKFSSMWEIESHFKCPVAGAILSVEKHRDILKKCGYNVSGLKSYEYHQIIMSKLNERNKVSEKVNNVIRSQAKKWMEIIDGMDDQQMRQIWKENFESGHVGPLMYAIVSYEDTTLDLLKDVYGEVHMKAHANMTGIFNVRKDLANNRAALDREKKKLKFKIGENKDLVKQRKEDAKRIAGLESENARLKKQVVDLEQRVVPETQDANARIRELEDRVVALNAELTVGTMALEKREQEFQAQSIEFARIRKENKTIRIEMDTLMTLLSDVAPPLCQIEPLCRQEACSHYRLCARRIFMIGGITKMKAYYKDIVEKAGGKFEYHDGYIKGAGMDIEAMVKKSDLVICPVSCNSHNACIKAKKLCNQHKIPLKILSSSSLSAVTQAVFSLEETTTLN
ncbi:DUF2325 domain-containing protein [Desulfobacter sp.]|uniref:DUF2325 domain-containing protein n=1 Tax=Desulfobacter sp. TaxID=2294 RepID=UPI003D1153B0